MSYIDIFVLVIIGLSLIFGLIGKWQKKLFALISVIVSVVIAYFITTPITNALLNMDSGILSFIGGESGVTISVFLANKLAAIPALASLSSMAAGVAKVVVFWLLSLVLMAIVGIIFGIISSIAFRNAKKGTAIRTLGLFSAIKGALVAIILVFPVFAFAPLLKNLTSIPNLPENIQPVVQMVEDHTNKSKAVAVTDWVFKNTKMQMMTYEHNGQTMYLYDDLNGISGLVQLSSLLTGGNPIQALAQMDASQLQEAIASIGKSPLLQETITNVVSEMVSQQMPGMEIGEINFENEGKMLATVVSVMKINVDPENPNNIDIGVNEEAINELLNSEEKLKEAVGALAESDLVLLFAENLQGQFEIPANAKSAIDSALEEKLQGADEATQQKLAALKAFFVAAE